MTLRGRAARLIYKAARLVDPTVDDDSPEEVEQDVVADFVRGTARVGGARVRLEWLDPEPLWVANWAQARADDPRCTK